MSTRVHSPFARLPLSRRRGRPVRRRSRRSRIARRVGIGAGVVLVGLGSALVYERPMLMTGTGYAAHNACAVTFIAGRGAAAASQDLPPNPLVPYLRTSVDPTRGTATTSVLGVLFKQTAHYHPDRGCVLGPGGTVGATATDLTNTPNADTAAQAQPAAARSVLPIRPADDAAITRAVDAAFGTDAARRQALGTRAVIVVHDGAVVAERYADGFTPATRQLGWSMAKSVTNLMVGRLVADGALSPEAPTGDARLTGAKSAITFDDMLRMATGLKWDEAYELGTPITEMLYLQDDMAGYVASLPLVHPHGTYQQYSSGTTNLLCAILHDRTRMGVDLADRLLFTPLGLAPAAPATAAGAPGVGPVWETDGVGQLTCSSYLWATPRDWAAIGQFALQNGVWNGRNLLPANWIAYSTRTDGPNGPIAGEEDGYGAGWWVNRRSDGTLRYPDLPADAYWASGHDGQRLVIVPSKKLVVVRLGFTQNDVEQDVNQLVEDLSQHL